MVSSSSAAGSASIWKRSTEHTRYGPKNALSRFAVVRARAPDWGYWRHFNPAEREWRLLALSLTLGSTFVRVLLHSSDKKTGLVHAPNCRRTICYVLLI